MEMGMNFVSWVNDHKSLSITKEAQNNKVVKWLSQATSANLAWTISVLAQWVKEKDSHGVRIRAIHQGGSNYIRCQLASNRDQCWAFYVAPSTEETSQPLGSKLTTLDTFYLETHSNSSRRVDTYSNSEFALLLAGPQQALITCRAFNLVTWDPI